VFWPGAITIHTLLSEMIMSDKCSSLAAAGAEMNRLPRTGTKNFLGAPPFKRNHASRCVNRNSRMALLNLLAQPLLCSVYVARAPPFIHIIIIKPRTKRITARADNPLFFIVVH